MESKSWQFTHCPLSGDEEEIWYTGLPSIPSVSILWASLCEDCMVYGNYFLSGVERWSLERGPRMLRKQGPWETQPMDFPCWKNTFKNPGNYLISTWQPPCAKQNT